LSSATRKSSAAYLRLVARHQMLMVRRKGGREVGLAEVEGIDAEWNEYAGDDGGGLKVEALKECLKGLDERERRALELRYKDDDPARGNRPRARSERRRRQEPDGARARQTQALHGTKAEGKSVKHEDTFFDASLREALSGEAPPDVLARVLARASAPVSASATGRSSAGRMTTRRWTLRALGALCLSVLAGGAASFAAVWFSPAPEQDAIEAALSGAEKSLDSAQSRVAEYDAATLRRQAELERLSAELSALEYTLASPEEKVERAMVARELKREERAKEAELARRERTWRGRRK
jgi:hypothetical protein